MHREPVVARLVEVSASIGEWAGLRDLWLTEASRDLAADPRVVGWALVGSFGRGEADLWSDLDLLVVTTDADFLDFTERSQNALWANADVWFDARGNAPAGGTSVGTVYLRSGLPIGVDWYVFPLSMAVWPTDAAIVEAWEDTVSAGVMFVDWIAQGPRQTPVDVAPEDQLAARMAMIPIAGKYLARGSPQAGPMAESLGASIAAGAEAADVLDALMKLAAELTPPCPQALSEAVLRYLAVVSATVRDR